MERLRIVRGLSFSVVRDGLVSVWQPQRREHVPIASELVTLLLAFGDGKTLAEASAASGLVNGALDDAVAQLVRRELLVPVGAAPVRAPPRPVARERIEQLIDHGTFEERAAGPIVTGHAQLDGRRVAIAAWEPDADDGVEDLLRLQEIVLQTPCPFVYLLDRFAVGSAPGELLGARSLGRVYANQARMAGRAPQVAVVCGALSRPAALLPVNCDAVIVVDGHGFIQIADTELVKELTGEDATPDSLGGARLHAEHSGLAHLVAASTLDAATLVRRYLALMPHHASAPLPRTAAAPPPALAPAALDALVPTDDSPFPIHDLVRALLDEGSPLELRAAWTKELSTTLGRLEGTPIGVIANCSQHKSGLLTPDALDKAAEFVALCDAYHLPLLFLVDVLGLAIGRAAERAGIERAAGRLLAALASSTNPKLTLLVRRANPLGLLAMCGPAFDADTTLALPTAALSTMHAPVVPASQARRALLLPLSTSSTSSSQHRDIPRRAKTGVNLRG